MSHSLAIFIPQPSQPRLEKVGIQATGVGLFSAFRVASHCPRTVHFPVHTWSYMWQGGATPFYSQHNMGPTGYRSPASLKWIHALFGGEMRDYIKERGCTHYWTITKTGWRQRTVQKCYTENVNPWETKQKHKPLVIYRNFQESIGLPTSHGIWLKADLISVRSGKDQADIWVSSR